MLITAKIIQVILGFLSLSFSVSALFAQSTFEVVGALSIAIALIVVVYMLQKYIAKNSTVIELKNYRLKIYQTILGFFATSQFINVILVDKFNVKIVSALLFSLFAFLMVAIEKRKVKNKKDAT